ncbi:hypothetical protein ACW95P_00065 [Candidatus Mycoplasma pogonae]
MQPIQQSTQIININQQSSFELSYEEKNIKEAFVKINHLFNDEKFLFSMINNSNNNIDDKIVEILNEKVFKNDLEKETFKQNFNKFFNLNDSALFYEKSKILNDLIKSTNDPEIIKKLKEELLNLENIQNSNKEKNFDFSLSNIFNQNYSNEFVNIANNTLDMQNRNEKKSILKHIPKNSFRNFNRQKSNLSINKNIKLTRSLSNKNFSDKKEYEEKVQKWSKEIEKLRKSIDSISKYLSSVKGFNIASATLTAAAWGLAATYTAAAFWTFGGTIPSAIAAGVQAGISTYFLNESFEMQYSLESTLNELNEILETDEWKIIEKLLKMPYNEFMSEIQKTTKGFKKLGVADILTIVDLTSTFSAIRMAGGKGIEAITKKIIEKIAAKTSSNLLKNYVGFTAIPKLTKFIYEKVVNKSAVKITSFASNLVGKRAALVATAWASPIGSIISLFDTVVSVSSIIHILSWRNE